MSPDVGLAGPHRGPAHRGTGLSRRPEGSIDRPSTVDNVWVSRLASVVYCQGTVLSATRIPKWRGQRPRTRTTSLRPSPEHRDAH